MSDVHINWSLLVPHNEQDDCILTKLTKCILTKCRCTTMHLPRWRSSASPKMVPVAIWSAQDQLSLLVASCCKLFEIKPSQNWKSGDAPSVLNLLCCKRYLLFYKYKYKKNTIKSCHKIRSQRLRPKL